MKSLNLKSKQLPPAIILIAILIVTILAWNSRIKITGKNGFNRVFENIKLIPLDTVKKDASIVEICGITDNEIYFRTKRPGYFIVTDAKFKKTRQIIIPAPQDNKTQSLFTTIVDSPNVSIMAGNSKTITIGRLSDTSSRVYNFPPYLFTRAIVLPSNSYIMRGYNINLYKMDQVFFKCNPINGQIINENKISELHNDAGISTDGLLHYDSKENRLIYINFFKNKFICMDTNLNLIYSTHTIDTVSEAQTEAGIANNSLTNLAPTRVLNARSSVWDGFLYNLSYLKADNEISQPPLYSYSVDIYEIKQGKYKGSFSIPRYKTENLKAFKVFRDKLFAIYDTHIICYMLN